MDLNQVLIEAAKDGNMLVLKSALEKGADIDSTDRSGMTALMYAYQKGYAQLADFLREKGAKEEEHFAIYYCKQGENYRTSGEHRKAIDNYTKAIELDPEYALAYNNRGNAYYDLKEYQKAMDDYTKAIELDPEFAAPYNNRGNAYYDLKEYRKAMDNFYQAGVLCLKQKNKAWVSACIDEMKKIDSFSPLIVQLQNLADQI